MMHSADRTTLQESQRKLSELQEEHRVSKDELTAVNERLAKQLSEYERAHGQQFLWRNEPYSLSA